MFIIIRVPNMAPPEDTFDIETYPIIHFKQLQ